MHAPSRGARPAALASLFALVALAPCSALLAEPLPGGSLDPASIPKYAAPLVIPPAMPQAPSVDPAADYYEIAVRQFTQQVLPPSLPPTTVWGYGSIHHPETFNFPSFTIEASHGRPVRVKWINQLVAPDGTYLPHLLPIDQTLHWANPAGGMDGRDGRGTSQETYAGPVPMVVHVHGAETNEWSDGYPEAWWLPAATNIPPEYAREGSFYDTFRAEAATSAAWGPGAAVFEYPNRMRPTTLWYHDHSLGITRQNVYAGPAGFYLLRGGPEDRVMTDDGRRAKLPRPAPAPGDEPGTRYFEIPLAIQDRSFNEDGSLFYPDNRAFFEGLEAFEHHDPDPPYLDIPFAPEPACDDELSDIGPSWNPEFFGNVMLVNGRTWPKLDVEQRRYRLRLLNGCNSRFLILRMSNDMPFAQIGAEGGYLRAPVERTEVLLAPAERADVIVDFTSLPVGTELVLMNLGPDEPYGGGTPGVEFMPADPDTTGQVMKFRVVSRRGTDPSTPADRLVLPPVEDVGATTTTRRLSLNELDSATVRVSEDETGSVVLDCENGEPFGPAAALLGTVGMDGMPMPMDWTAAISENPMPGSAEEWEIYNFTMDAHPVHVHLVQFQVVDRQALMLDEDGMAMAMPVGDPRPPEAWEDGYKDTVIAYPGEVTRIKARFTLEGLFVWHCHILEHEDNEMMRPFCVGDSPACDQADMGGHEH